MQFRRAPSSILAKPHTRSPARPRRPAVCAQLFVEILTRLHRCLPFYRIWQRAAARIAGAVHDDAEDAKFRLRLQYRLPCKYNPLFIRYEFCVPLVTEFSARIYNSIGENKNIAQATGKKCVMFINCFHPFFYSYFYFSLSLFCCSFGYFRSNNVWADPVC